jgi:ABC-type multidrug transport system ATPase subunit
VERAIADRAADATVVLACQHAAAAERLCDHLLFLRKGGLQWCAPVDAWRERFRRVRIRGDLDAVHELGELALHVERRGQALEALLDDPAGVAEARLRIAGAVVEPLPLPLDELLMAVAA